jgi:protein gp37
VAETTGIAWCDSTFNPWIGCTKISPGCDHCYAEALDKRMRYGGAVHWGAGTPRMRTSSSTWKAPLAWNRKQQQKVDEWSMGGRDIYPPRPHLVFCASLADVFDNEVPEAWRDDLFTLIEATPHLTWLLLTKRIGNASKMIVTYNHPRPQHNVWLGASIVNQEEADRDIPKLLATPAAKRFISYEPALGPVDFSRVAADDFNYTDALAPRFLPPLDWIIVGGESSQGGAKARPFDRQWAYDTIAQCKAAGVACFVKQLGSNVIARNDEHGCDLSAPRFLDRAGAEPREWPEDLRVQEFPT